MSDVKATPETLALLALIQPPDAARSTPRTDALYAALAPLHAAIEVASAAIDEIQKARRAADRTEEADYAYAFFERIRMNCESMTRELTNAEASIERVSEISFQLDQYGQQMHDSLTNRDARLAAEQALLATRVTISKDEYDHLKARADAGSAALAQVNATKGVTATDVSPPAL